MAPPALALNPVTNITSTTAQSGGNSVNISQLSGFNPTAKGVVFSKTNTIPTLADSFTNEFISDPTTNDWISIMTGLSPNTLYYVRSYISTDQPTTKYSTNTLSFTTLSGPSIPKSVNILGETLVFNGKRIVSNS